MLKVLCNTLFPYYCCLCRERSDKNIDLCFSCENLLPWAVDRCFRCGLRLAGRNDPIHCERCQENPPKYDRLCTLFDYVPPVTQFMTGLKFAGQLAYARVMTEFLGKALQENWYKCIPEPEAVLPVPLHAERIRKRGFNQALELLWGIKSKSKIKILLDVCQRIKATRPQSGLNQALRKQNLKYAFKVVKPIKYKHVAIMDDVVTTGSTVNAVCEAVLEAGVEQVDIWCICRV